MVACVLFRGFKSSDDELIQSWYRAADEKVKATFDSRVKFLAQRKPQDWGLPFFRRLHGDCSGLGEIRFKANKVQHRPIGFFSAENEFTILFFATEKGGKLVPKSACSTAQQRKQLISANRGGWTHEWRIEG